MDKVSDIIVWTHLNYFTQFRILNFMSLTCAFKTKSYETLTILYEYEIWSLTLKRRPWLVFESKAHRLMFVLYRQTVVGGCENFIKIVLITYINTRK
jgi:hypothetical protein